MNSELDLLKTFRAAAEAPSFREAAVRLGSSPQAITRAIQALESHYGELLFHRSTRQVRITAFGEDLLHQLRPALEGLDKLWRPRTKATASQIEGTVRISAPHSMGSRAVLAALDTVTQSHPGIVLDVRLSDRVADAVDEGIDVGIRVGFMRDSRFIAKKAGEMRLHVVGSPALVERIGAPAETSELSRFPLVASVDINTGRPWPWYLAGGVQVAPTAPVFIADNADMEMAGVIAGLGFAQLADYMAAPLIQSGVLQRVMEEFDPAPWGLYVYRPQRGPVSPRVRVVFDALHSAVGALPSLTQMAPSPTSALTPSKAGKR